VEMPKEGRHGYVRILREGIEYLAWLSVYGTTKEQRELAEAYIKLILQRAGEVNDEERGKAEEIVEKGKAIRSQTLENIEVEVEVNGKKYKVTVKGGKAFEEDRDNRKLLRIEITVGELRGERNREPRRA
jgi:hypothetical protein